MVCNTYRDIDNILHQPIKTNERTTVLHRINLVDGTTVEFPVEPYTSQKEVVEQILKTLNTNGSCLIESPTGSGKTLSILCSVLTFLNASRFKSYVKPGVSKNKLLNALIASGDSPRGLKDLKSITNDNKGSNVLMKSDISSRDPKDLKSITNDNKGSNVLMKSDISSRGLKDLKSITNDNKGSNVLMKSDISSRGPKGLEPILDNGKNAVALSLSSDVSHRSKVLEPNELHSGYKNPIQLSHSSDLSIGSIPLSSVKSLSIDGKNLLKNLSNSGQKNYKAPVPSQLSDAELLKQLSALEQTKTTNSKSLSASAESKSKIFICSRTIKQIDQLIDSLKDLNPKIKISILASRKQLCINKEVLQAVDVNDACHKLLKKKGCKYFTKSENLQNLFSQSPLNIEDAVKNGRCFGECPYYTTRSLLSEADVVFAPYNYLIDPFIRKSLSVDLKDAIVIVDEAHNIEDFCRSSGSLSLSSFEIKRYLDSVRKCFIIGGMDQEAYDALTHIRGLFEVFALIEANAMSSKRIKATSESPLSKSREVPKISTLKDLGTARLNGFQSGTRDIGPNSLNRTSRCRNDNSSSSSKGAPAKTGILHPFKSNDLKPVNYKQQILTGFPNFKSMSTKETHVYKGAEILEFLSTIGMRSENVALYKNAFKCLNTASNMDLLPQAILNNTELLIFILESIIINKTTSYCLSYEKTAESYKINFFLLDPSLIFKPLSTLCRSIILLSGTLKPFYFLENELGHKFNHCLEATHCIQESNLLVKIIQKGSDDRELVGKYSSESSTYSKEVLKAVLTLQKQLLVGGMLVFVPSYSFLEDLEKKTKGENVFFESKSGSKFEKIFKDYVKAVKNKDKPVLVCVYRGRASEGIDFKDDYARIVVAVGIPYPSFMDCEIIAKREFNDKYKKMNGKAWYEAKAFRAVNQAIGRVVRHKNDWGAVIFLDARYAWSKNLSSMSKWVKDNVSVCKNIQELEPQLVRFMKSKMDRCGVKSSK